MHRLSAQASRDTEKRQTANGKQEYHRSLGKRGHHHHPKTPALLSPFPESGLLSNFLQGVGHNASQSWSAFTSNPVKWNLECGVKEIIFHQKNWKMSIHSNRKFVDWQNKMIFFWSIDKRKKKRKKQKKKRGKKKSFFIFDSKPFFSGPKREIFSVYRSFFLATLYGITTLFWQKHFF